MNIFEDTFRILSTGTPVEIKEAKKVLEKNWRTDHKKFGDAFAFINKQIETFDLIKNPINKSAVITGMSMFYLALANEHFDVLKSFIVKNLQDPDGRVREAARKTGDWLYISLTDRSDQTAREQYIDFVNELENLIDKYDDELEVDVQYIDEMKPSVHKSIQQMWVKLAYSHAYREIIEKSTPITMEIFEKRKEVEKDLTQLLKDCRVDKYTDVDDIKQMIFEEDSVKDMSNIIRIFDNGDMSNLDNILMVVNDAWNYFPHRVINGKCPFELYPRKM